MSKQSRARQTERNKQYLKRKEQPPHMCRVLDTQALTNADAIENPDKVVLFANRTVQQLQPNGSLRTIGIVPKLPDLSLKP